MTRSSTATNVCTKIRTGGNVCDTTKFQSHDYGGTYAAPSSGPVSVEVCLSLVILSAVVLWPSQPTLSAATDETAGSLAIISKDGSVNGACPLRHTEVRAAVSGFLARVTVT